MVADNYETIGVSPTEGTMMTKLVYILSTASAPNGLKYVTIQTDRGMLCIVWGCLFTWMCSFRRFSPKLNGCMFNIHLDIYLFINMHVIDFN